MTVHENVVFFDGACVFCNRSVRRLIKIDHQKILKYSPLQGEFAQQVLDPQTVTDLSGVVLWSDGQVFHKSEATVRILMELGGGYKLLGLVLNQIPFGLLNIFYSLFAKNRYRLFGKLESCPLPKPEERELFIP